MRWWPKIGLAILASKVWVNAPIDALATVSYVRLGDGRFSGAVRVARRTMGGVGGHEREIYQF